MSITIITILILLALKKRSHKFKEWGNLFKGLLIDFLVDDHMWSHLCTTKFTKDYSGQYINPRSLG